MNESSYPISKFFLKSMFTIAAIAGTIYFVGDIATNFDHFKHIFHNSPIGTTAKYTGKFLLDAVVVPLGVGLGSCAVGLIFDKCLFRSKSN